MISTPKNPRVGTTREVTRVSGVYSSKSGHTPKQETDLKIKLDYVVRAPTPLGQRSVPATGDKE
jgi:hypothetical protein